MDENFQKLLKLTKDVLGFGITCISGLDDEEFYPKLKELEDYLKEIQYREENKEKTS